MPAPSHDRSAGRSGRPARAGSGRLTRPLGPWPGARRRTRRSTVAGVELTGKSVQALRTISGPAGALELQLLVLGRLLARFARALTTVLWASGTRRRMVSLSTPTRGAVAGLRINFFGMDDVLPTTKMRHQTCSASLLATEPLPDRARPPVLFGGALCVREVDPRVAREGAALAEGDRPP